MKKVGKIVELREKPVVFGRMPVPYTDVCLLHAIVAKRLFEIRWNSDHNCHEVEVYRCVYPPSLNGDLLNSDGECRSLSVGDALTIGPFRIEYTTLRRAKGRWTFRRASHAAHVFFD